MFEKRNKLCLRQSAGDSTGPQVDIAADRLGQLGLEVIEQRTRPFYVADLFALLGRPESR
jgi:hypothetical protein